ncbi:cardiolipin synthase [Alteribacillus persepolensis]|uniref:Cardiolipin synthase n=1 Tax=Alteribacillus persepolensis TaxID=568899 RepID=A0A1G8FK95_9BACI|nr:cardiolipin synthase [Alteribacillus persepolensis]SDH82541.1 cardiolipin synthase [Alteribacillus persepolensis]
MDVFSLLMGFLFLLNVIFASVIIFLERKDATSTWAWLMVLLFIPFLGFILYLILGQNMSRKRLFDWEDIKKIGIENLINEQIESLREQRFQFTDPNSREYRDLIYMQLVNNDALLTQDNAVDLFTDGAAKFQQLFEDIEKATDHIHLQYYILRYDSLGAKLLQALTEKAKEGVKVRVLYDDMGSRGLSKKVFRPLLEAGGAVEIFFPKRIPLINLRLNYRNHRKLVIIDGKIGYVGGFNIGDEYLGLNPKFGYWRDTHLRLQGQVVKAVQTRFILDWNQATHHHHVHYDKRYFPTLEPAGDLSAQIVSSGPDSEWEQIKNGYIKMITSAKESVYIQTPYFIPDQSLMDALQIAALSGKDVRIMIPDKPDHPFVYWATLSHIGELLKTGARVFIYKNGFIHAKTIVVDGKVSSVGTANIDVRSFRLNFEVNAFLYHQPTAQRLAMIYEQDMTHSNELTLSEYKQRSLWIRFKESISHLLSPIL